MSQTLPNIRRLQAIPSRSVRPATLVLLALALGGCAGRASTPPSQDARFQREIRTLLNENESTSEFQEMRLRLQAMGPELDAVLVALVRDRAARPAVRANALLVLAERGAPGTFEVIERALDPTSPTPLRAAALLGLQRLAPTSPEATRLIRATLRDPSRAVRLNALMALDVTDVETMRTVLETDRDREVRQVALQLVTIAEARGAGLANDPRGTLRTTTGSSLDPQIVFRPGRPDPATGMSSGDLRLELPNAIDIPLASNAISAGSVVPAFFSSDHGKVVFETEGEIRTIDIPSRNIRTVGSGLAPRVIPFANFFVFVRERSRTPPGAAPTIRITYDVLRAGFEGGSAERIGELVAEVRADIADRYSPVRRMVIGETLTGLELRGEGIVVTFLIPDLVIIPTRRAVALH